MWKTNKDVNIYDILQEGWLYSWKSRLIWIFCALIFIEEMLYSTPYTLLNVVLPLTVNTVCNMGVIHIAYCNFMGIPAIFQETLQLVTTKFWRATGLFILCGLIIFFPILCVQTIYFPNLSPQLSSSYSSLAIIPFYLFIAMLYFSLAEVAINSSGIRKSLQRTWLKFIKHFGVLAWTGLILAAIPKIVNILIAALAMLLQSNFELSSLSTLNFINPRLSLPNNGFFIVTNALAQAILFPYSIVPFIFAFLKYSSVNANLAPP